MKTAEKQIYTIDAGRPFAQLIAEQLLHDYKNNQHGLTDVTLLLPTRRACRNVQNIFLQITKGKPLLLPKIQPMGDVDEQDLSLALAGSDMLDKILDLPPAISPLRRRILLGKAISATKVFTQSFDKAIALADALAQFLDQIIIEDLEFANLEHIVPAEFADHWQITLEFLKILGERWPAILAEEGAIDAAQRRNILMRMQADYWLETKTEKPIIAAGSTGSIPATAYLLSAVASLPNGKLILPGLDQDMDDKSWASLGECHPQFGLKHLLSEMNVTRAQVKAWEIDAPVNRRMHLASEIMRPSETSKDWQNSFQSQNMDLTNALNNLKILELKTQHDEAKAIALKFRETLEHPSKTAALITPDRTLARQGCAMCKHWGIDVDDSSGKNLSTSSIGIFSLLVLEAAMQNASPKALLALFKNKYFHAGIPPDARHQEIADLEKYALRGVKPKAGFNGLKERLENLERSPDMSHILEFLKIIEPKMKHLIDLMSGSKTHFFKEFLQSHISLMEDLATTPHKQGEDILWMEEDGETMAQLLSELWEHADAFDPVDGQSYMRILSHLMSKIAVRPKFGTHPRLYILGQLESRLIDADILILSGLNEGIWPPDPGHDPWMSRPMRKEFGLPSPERSVGLAAHDFVQGFCNENILLTRAKTVDGTHKVPARWLQRLDTVLKTNNKSLEDLYDQDFLVYLKELDRTGEPEPYKRPEPKPPVEARPKKLSVTKIETWMKDPYSIYASDILRLKKLEPLEKPIEAKEKGIILHNILERFITAHKDNLPANSPKILKEMAQEEIQHFPAEESEWSFWWPRFEKISDWFIANERSWRQSYRTIAQEAEGNIVIEAEKASLHLKGIADRIDMNGQGDCAIIDYKTGGSFSAKKMASGETPQLPLEALILVKNGFSDNKISGKNVSYLGYWCLTGGTEPGSITYLPKKDDENLAEIIETTHDGLKALIDSFANPETPYICLPKSSQTPRFNDYEHLERIKEWAALDDAESETA